MNKYKTLNTLFCAISLSLFCSAAVANQEIKPTYYENVFFGISVDSNYFLSSTNEYISSTQYIYGDNYHKASSYSIIAGKRWKHLGLQIGYSFFPTRNSYDYSDSYSIYTKPRYSNKFADALFYYPINKWCDFKSLLGIGLMHSKASGSVYYFYRYPYSSETIYFDLSRNQLSPRLGLGAEFKIIPHITMDFMVKYQKANFLYRDDIIVSAGVYYYL